jgi:hypothetical protein
MGLFSAGTYVCPEGELDGGEGGSEGQEDYPGGGGGGWDYAADAVIIRFSPDVISFPQDREDAPRYFEAPLEDAELALPSLATLLTGIGAASFSTIAPGWRHLTPERSVSFQGDPIDLVDFTDVYHVTLDGRIPVEDAIEHLWGQPGVVYAERDGPIILHDFPEDPPDDPYYDQEYCGHWYLHNPAEGGECGCTPDIDINAPEAWEICYQRNPPIKAGTKIANMETRVNELHDDLRPYIDCSLSGNFATGEWQSGVENWGNGGLQSHATAMPAMAGVGTDNGVCIASVANTPPSHDNDVLSILVIVDLEGRIGSWEAGACALDWICTYPLARGRIRVVNMSWGTPRWKFCHDLGEHLPGLATFRDACRNASRTGVNLVASGGNLGAAPPQGWENPCGAEADTAFVYPAAFPDYCLAIAALGCRGQVNEDFAVGSYMDLAGPGVGADSLGMVPGGGTDGFAKNGEGTSPASPFIASTVSLLLGAQYNLYPEDCAALLKASARSYGNESIQVGCGMPRLDDALEWVTDDHRVFHGSTDEITSWELVEGWEDPKPVVLKNIPPELCEEGNGEQWQELNLKAYRVTTVVQIDPPEGGSIEMVWPRGVGSSGWRLLDETLEGYPDPNVPAYYDVNYYENWAHLEEVVGNEYTFVTYTYQIVLQGDDCWVPFHPDTGPYNLNYSYVAYDPNMPSTVAECPASKSLDLAVSSSVVPAGGRVLLAVSLPEPAQVWLGVYSVDGRLVYMLQDGTRLASGVTNVTWELTSQVTSGAYFVRARARLAGTEQSVGRARLVVVR